ncbi:MAG: LLM class flavin-dependent oxidoreductase [Solirubrobacteraceae bacterium]
MKFGYVLPSVHSVELNAQVATLAEELGFSDLFVGDHILGAFPPDAWRELPGSAMVTDADSWLDPFCLLTALASHTRLRLGTCVTDATRRSGADLVRAALTIDQLAPGGCVLGIGAGAGVNIIPFSYDFRRPVGNLERGLIEIRALLDTGKMPEGVGRTGLLGDRVPEVWVGAEQPRAARLAGRYGDGWWTFTHSLERFLELRDIVRAAAGAAGRAMPTVSAARLTVFGESREDIAARMEAAPMSKLLALFLPAEIWAQYGLEHPCGADCKGMVHAVPHAVDPAHARELASQIPFELMEEVAIIGNADEMREKLDPFLDAGAEHVTFYDFTGVLAVPPEVMAAELEKLVSSLRDSHPIAV